MIPRVLLPALLLLAACASSAPPPALDGVPPDFRLEVRSVGATNPHCDFDLSLTGAGSLDYVVSHRGAKAGDRRGRADLPAAAVRGILAAVEEGGLLDLPPRVPPAEGGGERGVVTFTVRLRGRTRTVVADRAGTPGTDGVLAALFRETPGRMWKVPGAE